MSKRGDKTEPTGKFGILEGLSSRSTARQENVEPEKQQTDKTPKERPQLERFSNYLRADLYDRLHAYVAKRKRQKVKLIDVFNQAIEEFLDRHEPKG